MFRECDRYVLLKLIDGKPFEVRTVSSLAQANETLKTLQATDGAGWALFDLLENKVGSA